MPGITRMQQKRATAAEWYELNPTLADGEIGYERDTRSFKVGDGVTPWRQLDPTFSPEYIAEQISLALNGEEVMVGQWAINAVAAALAGKNVVYGDVIADESGMSRAWADQAGRVAMYIDLNGHVGIKVFDAATAAAIKASVQLGREDIVEETGYARAWVDLQNRVSLYIDNNGHVGFGKIDAKTATMLATALNLSTSISPLKFDTGVGGRIRSVAAGPDICLWGDSLTASGSIGTKLAELTGRTVRNGGVGGEGGHTITARMGVTPFLLTVAGGAIPADTTPVDVTFTIDFPGAPNGKPFLQGTGVTGVGDSNFYGTLAGVRGRFYLRVKDPAVAYPSGSANDIYSFVRTTAGSVVTLNKAMPFVPEFAFDRAGDIQFIWIGQNGPVESENTALFRLAIQQMQAPLKRYILASRTGFSNTGLSTEETNLQREFGRRYVNIRRYLIDHALSDLGMTPTAQDTTDMAAGTIPTSLRTDGVHHTAAAQQAIAEFLVLPRMRELGYV